MLVGSISSSGGDSVIGACTGVSGCSACGAVLFSVAVGFFFCGAGFGFGGNPAIKYHFVDYEEHALETNSDSKASAYVVIADESGRRYWGVGVDSDITMASVYALITAVNRANKDNQFIPTND